MALVTQVYQCTRLFPNEEMYGLISQMRRSAVSIPSNIAEGFGRHSTNEYVRFLHISMGSLFELETQLQIAQNLGYLNQDQHAVFEDDCREVERILSALIAGVERRKKGK